MIFSPIKVAWFFSSLFTFASFFHHNSQVFLPTPSPSGFWLKFPAARGEVHQSTTQEWIHHLGEKAPSGCCKSVNSSRCLSFSYVYMCIYIYIWCGTSIVIDYSLLSLLHEYTIYLLFVHSMFAICVYIWYIHGIWAMVFPPTVG